VITSKRRRSQRLILSVPIIVSGESVTGHFNERTRTLVVNAHGALITLAAIVSAGQRITIQHRTSGEEQACRVVYVEPSPKDEEKVAVEFLKSSPHFWHIAFPPADWSPESADSQGDESSAPLSAETNAIQENDRRHATRYNFGAIAEIVDIRLRRELVAVTRDLSLSGCFLSTTTPLAKGTEVRVRITSSGAEFRAAGKVTGNVTSAGMGVEFVEIAPSDKAVIEKWLGLATMSEGEPPPSSSETHRAQRLIPGIPITVSGDLPAGVFSEETETQTIRHDGALFRLSTPVAPGQIVRLKNRLTRMEQNCCVLFVDQKIEQGKPRLLAVQFLEPVQNFWGTEPQS
jgi:hypothetical protein